MESITQNFTANQPVARASMSDFSILFDPKTLREEVSSLSKELSTLRTLEPSAQLNSEIKTKEQRLEKLKDLKDGIVSLSSKKTWNQPSNYNTVKLRKAYDRWIKFLAKSNNSHVLDSKAAASFDKLIDFYDLNHDSFQMANAINNLTNPIKSKLIFQKHLEIRQEYEKNKAEHLKTAIESFLSKIEGNDLLNAMYEQGVFMSPSDLEVFLKNGIIPQSLIDVASGMEIPKDSDRYNRAIELLSKYNNEVRKSNSQQTAEAAQNPTTSEPLISSTQEETGLAPEVPISKSIEKEIENASSIKDLQDIESDLLTKLTDVTEAKKSGIDAGKISQLIENKKLELQNELELSDIKEGDTVLVKNPQESSPRLSNKELKSVYGTIRTGDLREAKLSRDIIDKTVSNKGLRVYINKPKLRGILLSRGENYLFRAMQGRFFTIAKVGNFYLPFYISSQGTSGKSKGRWYPFFGFTGSWLIKGKVTGKGEMVYSKEISAVQDILNNNFIIPTDYLTHFGQIISGGTPASPESIIYDINDDIKYESWFINYDRNAENKYTETDFVGDITGFYPSNVKNDGKGSADQWIADVVALTIDAEQASKGVIKNIEKYSNLNVASVVTQTPESVIIKESGKVPEVVGSAEFNDKIAAIYTKSPEVKQEKLEILDVPMMSDAGLEASTMQKKKEGFNKINPEEQFYADVKRKILSEIFKNPSNGTPNVPGIGQVRLTIMAADKIQDTDLRPETQHFLKMREAKEDHSRGVSIVLTDVLGNILRINPETLVKDDDNGKVAYWNLRNPSFDEKGSPVFQESDVQYESFDDSRIKDVATKLSLPLNKAREIVKLQLSNYKKIRDFINLDKENNTVPLNITGGNLGRTLDTKEFTPLSQFNAPSGLNLLMGDFIEGQKEDHLYFKLEGINDPVEVQNPFTPDNLVDKFSDLLSMDLKKITEEGEVPVSMREKLDIISQFYSKDTVDQLEKGEGDVAGLLSTDRLIPNKANLDSGLYTDFTISPEGLFKIQDKPYSNFIYSNFGINKRLDANGNLETVNAYFNFEAAAIGASPSSDNLETSLNKTREQGLVYDSENNTGYTDKYGVQYSRVSALDSTIIDRTEEVELAAQRGKVINELFRGFMDGNLQDWKHLKSSGRKLIKARDYKVSFTDIFFKSLEENFNTIKEQITQNNLEVVRNVPTVYGKINDQNYASDLDLLVRDSSGNYTIISLKTSSQNRRTDYDNNKWAYKLSDQIQMNAIRELFKQSTGIDIKSISILPMLTIRDKKGVYTMSKLSKDLNKYTIKVNTSKDIYQILKFRSNPNNNITSSNSDVDDFVGNCVL